MCINTNSAIHSARKNLPKTKRKGLKTMFKYYFYIIDNEFNDEYFYEGYFEDHFEADKFIRENEDAGNTVTMVAPFYHTVSAEEFPYQVTGAYF